MEEQKYINGLPLFEAKIDFEDGDMGVNRISFVDSPATEVEMKLFSKQNFQDTYNDYPQQAVDNAKKGIELNEAVNNKCATAVGKQRAQDIANKRGLSFDVIKRTYSYLSRAEEYYDENDEKACGTISFLLWGGKSMKSWCEQKINEIEKGMMREHNFEIANEDKRLITSVVMQADTPILRQTFWGEYYYIQFSAEQLEKMMIRYSKDGKMNNFNEDHTSNKLVDGITMFESWQIADDSDKAYALGFTKEQAPIGSWMFTAYVEDEDYWNDVIKSGKFKGVSFEIFAYKEPVFEMIEDKGKALESFSNLIDSAESEEELKGIINAFINKI